MTKDTTKTKDTSSEEATATSDRTESDADEAEIPSILELTQNPDLISQHHFSQYKLLQILLYSFVYFLITLYRALPFPIRAVLTFIVGGYTFEYWENLVALGSIGNSIMQATIFISSMSSGSLVLSASILIAGFTIAYAIRTSDNGVSDTDSDNREPKPDGGSVNQTIIERIVKFYLEAVSPDAVYFSPSSAIVGGIIGMLIGGVFAPQWVLPFGIGGIVFGEEVGYRLNIRSGSEVEDSPGRDSSNKTTQQILSESLQKPATVHVVVNDGSVFYGRAHLFAIDDEDEPLLLYNPYHYVWNAENEEFESEFLEGQVFIPNSSISYVIFPTVDYLENL